MIFRLAVKDIVHDWLLSMCLVLAIASIITPLLILFGLKFGTIQTMRGRLIEDPKIREIRPMTTRSFSGEWLASLMADNPLISFVVPLTRQISTTVKAANESAALTAQLSLVPTAAGDPLLLENGVEVPAAGFCVLTEAAAQALGLAVGDQVHLSTKRILQGRSEIGTLTARVSGILEMRVSGLKTAYVPLSVVEAVEDYKDGRAVPAYGWEGELPVAYPVYEGAAIFTVLPLSKMDEVLLLNNTGFTEVQRIDQRDRVERFGYAIEEEWLTYLLTVRQRRADENNVQAVRNKLRGRGAVVVPWVEALRVTLIAPAHGRSEQVRLHAVAEESEVVASTVPPLTWSDGSGARPVVLVSMGSQLEEGEATLELVLADRRVDMPILVKKGAVAESSAYGPLEFVGRLNLLRYRDLLYDKQSDRLLLTRGGYAGFRLYAASIDDVAEVKRSLEDSGLPVSTEQERIGEVRRLDTYLSLVFWLIAAVGILGGISAMTASLYASVERKRKELNMLRLLGLLKRELVMFPVSQGLLLSSGALLLAGGAFVSVSSIINHLFREHLRSSESLCVLTPGHFLLLVSGVAVLSVVSATFAALQATRVDPAEALRDE